MQKLWKYHVLILTVRRFFNAKHFQSGKSQVVIFWCMFRALKVFCMEKSAQDLDVDIELSKCWACDAENFESDILYPRKLNFLHANIFQSGMLAKKPRGHISMDVRYLLWKCFACENLRKILMGNKTFQVPHVMQRTLKVSCCTLGNWILYMQRAYAALSNMTLSKCFACRCLNLGRCRSFESEILGKRWEL